MTMQNKVQEIEEKLKEERLKVRKEESKDTVTAKNPVGAEIEQSPDDVAENESTGTANEPIEKDKDDQQPTDFATWAANMQEIGACGKRGAPGKGAMSVVNHENGKRIRLSKDILEPLNSPEKVRVLIDKNNRQIHFFSNDKDGMKAHVLKGSPTKNTIYSVDLVNEVTELYNLDFSERSSTTFGKTEVLEIDGITVVTVKSTN